MHESQARHRLLSRIRALEHVGSRRAQHAYWIEGLRQFIQAYDTGQTFEAIAYSPILLRNGLAEMLLRRLGRLGVPRIRFSPEEFRGVSKTERASGIGAIIKQRWTPMEGASVGCGRFWLVVESIRNAGNLGTMVRTAEAAGGAGIIFVGPRSDPFDPAVVRASMGGLFHLTLIRATHMELERWAISQGVHLIGLTPHAPRRWTDLPSATAYGLVLGEERTGLSPELQRLCHTTVQLPMRGKADSLNVGVAAGVMMYELVRRDVVAQ
jgi:TrmH family RNA methyltransferase